MSKGDIDEGILVMGAEPRSGPGMANETEAGKGGEVELEDGERIPYAALVLATGCTWPTTIELPSTRDDAQAHIDSWREKFKNAQHVVIVGGGTANFIRLF